MSYISKDKKVNGHCGELLFMENFIERRPSVYEEVYRNGHEPVKVKTKDEDGSLPPSSERRGRAIPIRLGAFLKGNTEALEKLTIEMYARGLSTRDIEDALLEATGDMVLSKTAV